jgi:hypothetical protein
MIVAGASLLSLFEARLATNPQTSTSQSPIQSSQTSNIGSATSGCSLKTSNATERAICLDAFVKQVQNLYNDPPSCATGFSLGSNPLGFSKSELLSMSVLNSTTLTIKGQPFYYTILSAGNQSSFASLQVPPGGAAFYTYTASYFPRTNLNITGSATELDVSVDGAFASAYTIIETPSLLANRGVFVASTSIETLRIVTVYYDQDCGPQYQRLWLLLLPPYVANVKQAYLDLAHEVEHDPRFASTRNGSSFALDPATFATGAVSFYPHGELKNSTYFVFSSFSNQTETGCGGVAQTQTLVENIEVAIPFTQDGHYDLANMALTRYAPAGYCTTSTTT